MIDGEILQAIEEVLKKKMMDDLVNDLGLDKDEARSNGKYEFIEILAQYEPDCSIYPEYKGKPYYSIHYKKNGEEFVGFGTYNPEVLSRYLRDYFFSPKIPTGEWINLNPGWWTCSFCHSSGPKMYNFCPDCGAKMKGGEGE